MPTSFYDLPYIIEVNERRFGQYKDEYEKITSKISHLLIIYSVFSFLLLPICKDLCNSNCNKWLVVFLTIGALLIFFSIIYAILFFSPSQFNILTPPFHYYQTRKAQYENYPSVAHNHRNPNGTINYANIDITLMLLYVEEIEKILDNMKVELAKKYGYYQKAFFLGVATLIPYIICAIIHINIDADEQSKEKDKIYKTTIENIDKFRIFGIDTLKKESKSDTQIIKIITCDGRPRTKSGAATSRATAGATNVINIHAESNNDNK